MTNKFIVNIDEVIRVQKYLKEINKRNLEDIQFIRDTGAVVELTRTEIADWKYMGLNNDGCVDTYQLHKREGVL
jgi:hypothetical protein